ncbi:MAG: hypothetical protein U0270_15820 [Labilithrix sp.]
MKLEALVGTLLLGSLIACSSKDEKPADAQQPAAATAPATTKDTTKPADDASETASGTPATPGPTPAEPAPTTAAPPGPETCDSLAAKAATPAGKISDVKTLKGPFGIEPVDVYATEDDEGLHIVLTETANACSYHANNLRAQAMNELTLTFPKTDKAFGPGSFDAFEGNQEAGVACMAEDATSGSIGTAWSGGSLHGKITITNKTATLVEGTIEVTDVANAHFTFSAPICTPLAPEARPTCCASPQQ